MKIYKNMLIASLTVLSLTLYQTTHTSEASSHQGSFMAPSVEEELRQELHQARLRIKALEYTERENFDLSEKNEKLVGRLKSYSHMERNLEKSTYQALERSTHQAAQAESLVDELESKDTIIKRLQSRIATLESRQQPPITDNMTDQLIALEEALEKEQLKNKQLQHDCTTLQNNFKEALGLLTEQTTMQSVTRTSSSFAPDSEDMDSSLMTASHTLESQEPTPALYLTDANSPAAAAPSLADELRTAMADEDDDFEKIDSPNDLLKSRVEAALAEFTSNANRQDFIKKLTAIVNEENQTYLKSLEENFRRLQMQLQQRRASKKTAATSE